jgi:stress response protein YsnF
MNRPVVPVRADIVVPLNVEKAYVALRKVERGGVRVRVQTNIREHPIDEILTQERVEIERIAIGRPVNVVPPVREDGDTTVISVFEEVVVVERRLVLKEEIRLRRVRTTERHRESVTLREQKAVIERIEPGSREGTPSPNSRQ